MIFQEVNDVKNSTQLSEFLSKEYRITQPIDNEEPLYRIILIQNFNDNKSCFILKLHHAFSDGQGAAIILQTLSENCSVDNLGLMKKFKLSEQIRIWLRLPTSLIYALYITFFLGKDTNIVQTGQHKKYQFKGAFEIDIDL